MAKHKVIFDTDPGVDDMMAIFMMAGHPDIDIWGFTTTYGNASVDTTTRNAIYLAKMLTPTVGYEIPVYKGVAKPMMFENNPHYADSVHGKDGLGDVMTIPDYTVPTAHISAAEYIVKTVRQNPGEISLVAVGPLGNIALAMLLEPQLPTLCRDLFIMGGSFFRAGNITPAAEANIYNAPHEADIVFGGHWRDNSTIAGLDVTYAAPFRQSFLQDLSATGALAKNMWDMGAFYLNFYTNICKEPAIHCHDAFAVALMTDADMFTTATGSIRVLHDGICRGQTVFNDTQHGTADDTAGNWNRPPINIALSVDTEAFKTLFADCIHNI